MLWNETVASEARYGDRAEAIFGKAEIIWEKSEADYQGSVTLLARMPDGRLAWFTYDYGSCSGCDSWEASDASDDAIEREMEENLPIFFPNDNAFASWFANVGALPGIYSVEALNDTKKSILAALIGAKPRCSFCSSTEIDNSQSPILCRQCGAEVVPGKQAWVS